MTDKKTIRTTEEKNKLEARLNRIQGQLIGVKKMIDDNRYCEDIIMQLLAISKASESLANVILEKHLKTCIKNSIEKGDSSIIDEIQELIKRYITR